MARVRSRNRTSDKGKIHFYKGRDPTPHELTLKDDRNQALFVDEVQQAGTVRMKIVVTWVPAGQRQQFRKHMDRIDPKLKKTREAKYANTHPADRIDFYESAMDQDFELYDSYNLEIPPDVVTQVYNLQGRVSGYWESRYIYQLYEVVRQALNNHSGRIDIVIDNPPLDIVENIKLMCNKLIEEGFDIQWVTIAPSRHIIELQTQDIIAGLDYDYRTGWIHQDPHIKEMSKQNKKRYSNILERLKSKLRN